MTTPENHIEKPENVSNSASNGLTGIPKSIHCPATQTSGGSSNHELNNIQVEHFLDTLAEVALSIAARELSEKQEQDQERDS